MPNFYVPLYFNWIEDTAQLNDAEKGRLVDAIVLYARGEDWQERIKGNERFVFPIFKGNMDRQKEISDKRAVAGALGGKQTQANSSNAKQTQAGKVLLDKDKDKYKEKDKEKDKNKDKDEECRGNDAHAHTHARTCEENDNGNDGSVTGIDGTPLDLSRAQHLDEAERLVKRFRLPLNETVLEAVADDIETHGLDVVQAAFIKAAEGDTRGGLSLNFYRAVLLNKGSGKPSKGFAQNNMITHSPEDRRDFIRKAVVNLDDV